MTADTPIELLGPLIEPLTQDEELDRLNSEKQYTLRELLLTPEQGEFIETKLSSKKWRMSNLYTIRDKNSTKMLMRLNNAQQIAILQFKHNRKIILKSRQQGISTLFLAYYLDSCLFIPGYQAGIQSYGMDEAAKLQKRAELMWDDLDPDIKEMLGLKLISNNSKGMTFSNGSILKIGNFRGDTLQGLHISELGKIAKKYPEKAKELKTGAFQAVGTGNKITIESTAEGQTGLFYEIWVRAMLNKALGKKLTPIGFEPIFLGWLEDVDCQLDQNIEPEPYHIEYLEKLEKEINIKLTRTQKNWLFEKLDELGEDFDQEYPATPDRAFAQSVEGSYFKVQYNRILREKRIIPRQKYSTTNGAVTVSFDLGINDEMVLLFHQDISGVPNIINEYHNTGQGLEHYDEILRALPYNGNYGKIIMPHDINVRELGTGRTRIETLRRLGWTNIVMLDRLSFQDSIQAARQFMKDIYIWDSCENTILGIQNYRKKYDKQIGVYLSTDVHDIHSNYMASFRYMAQGLRYHRHIKDKREPEVKEVPWNKKHDSFKDFAI